MNDLYNLYSLLTYIDGKSLPLITPERKALLKHLQELSDIIYTIYKKY